MFAENKILPRNVARCAAAVFALAMVVSLCSVLTAGRAFADIAAPSEASPGAVAASAGGSLVASPAPLEAGGAAFQGPSSNADAARPEEGVYQIGVRGSLARCLEAASTMGAASVRVAKSNASSLEQRWKLARMADGSCCLTNVATGRKLGVNRKGAIATGTVKSLGAKNGNVFKWNVRRTSGGTLQLVNKASGKAVSVATGKSNKAGSASASKGSRAQQIAFRRVSTLPNGTYFLFMKLAQTKKTVQIPGGSVTSGVRARIGKAKGANCERFVLACLDKDANAYSLQSVSSGRYLTDSKGTVRQRSKSSGGKLSKSQRWVVEMTSSGLKIRNVASGRVLAVSGGKARSGAALNTRGNTGAQAQRFRAVRVSRTLADGTYAFASRVGKFRLDVSGSSWKVGTNVQMWTPNAYLAQKFTVRYAGGGYYRIRMALAQTAVAARVSGKGKSANVRMARASSASAQLWKPIVSDRGIMFKNKATGGVLGSSGKVSRGSNVRVSADKGLKSQAWSLKGTKVNVRNFDTLREVVNHVPAGGNRSIKVDAKGTGYRLSKARRNQLESALGEAWRRGANVSVVMVDLDTGVTLSVGPDRDNHGASVFKAAYVTYIFQNILERGGNVDAGARSLMWQTISYSSNEAYEALRSRYGTGGFRSWLDDVGLGHLANQPFPRLTARNLARVWTKISAYENSGARHVGEWRRLFDHSVNSFIRERLGRSNRVYSKPGWYPNVGNVAAFNDGGIVKGRDGRTYLLSIISNTNCYSDQWIMRNIAGALDAVHREMPRRK